MAVEKLSSPSALLSNTESWEPCLLTTLLLALLLYIEIADLVLGRHTPQGGTACLQSTAYAGFV